MEYPTGMGSSDWLDQCLDAGRKTSDTVDHELDKGEDNSDENDDRVPPHKPRIGSKPHSTPLTLKWLEENYEIAEGVCIPRSTLYLHYLDFCEKTDTQPVNAASFGKIIRQQFQQITTRRLGTRGQSKYHYYGIGVRESSPYYDVMYSAKGVQNYGDGKRDTSKQIVTYSPRSKLGTLLPEFPDVKEIKMPPNVEEEKVLTFLMMYRTHCQRILDTVIRASFDEVQSFLLHFWQGMPPHMVPILDSQTIVMLVGVCDTILYKAIASVLMPTVLQALPDSLTQVIRKFAKQLDEWLKQALQTLPENLQRTKFDLARRFAQVLRRQTSLNHLCQAARTVVHSADITCQMLEDWQQVDLSAIVKQTLYTMDQYSDADHATINSLCSEFEKLLEEQAPIESYIDWLDGMVTRCVIKPSIRQPGSLRRVARQFLLMWSCFGTRVIRDMTLHSAPSFGSFHLLHLMFDDYVLYLVENLHSQERGSEFLRAIKGEATPGDLGEDLVLPDPSMLKESLMAGPPAPLGPPAPPLHQERGSVITNARAQASALTGYNNDVSMATCGSGQGEGLAGKQQQQPQQLMGAEPARPRLLSAAVTGASSANSSLYQPGPAAAYNLTYAQPLGKTGNVQQAAAQPLFPYDVTSSQMLPGGHLDEAQGRGIMLQQQSMRTASTGSDWTSGQQRQQSAIPDTSGLLRVADAAASNYGSYQTMRQGGFDYNAYAAYDPSGKSGTAQLHENATAASASYGCHGYGPVTDFYNPMGFQDQTANKRRLDDDPFLRGYKRQGKDHFYYEGLPSGFT